MSSWLSPAQSFRNTQPHISSLGSYPPVPPASYFPSLWLLLFHPLFYRTRSVFPSSFCTVNPITALLQWGSRQKGICSGRFHITYTSTRCLKIVHLQNDPVLVSPTPTFLDVLLKEDNKRSQLPSSIVQALTTLGIFYGHSLQQ